MTSTDEQSNLAAEAQPDLVGRLTRKLLSSIKPSPENDKLYDRNDASIVKLSEHIEKEGLLEPLVVTEDRYLLGGHRRLLALELLGRVKVPVRVVNVRRSDMSRDAYIALLRQFNRSREKSTAEKLRETLVDLSAEDAYESLKVARDKSINAASRNGLKPTQIEGSKHRSAISDSKDDHVKHILQIVEDRKQYWPLSVRAVHYPLLNFNFVRGHYYPRRTDPDYGRPRELKYVNDDGSYDATVDLITRLRLNGELPWEAFDDPTRPVQEFRPFRNVREFIEQQCSNTPLAGYWRDLLQSQPHHIEVIVEKNTVYHMAKQVTEKYQITTRSARGLCSIDTFHDIAEAFENSEKDRLVLIILSDYDPEGELIPHDAGRRLRDDFNIPEEKIQVFKAGVTREQITAHKLPSMNFAKETSSRFDWYVERNGGNTEVYELEALAPKVMLDDLDRVIRSVIDINLFNMEVAAEKEESPFLEAANRQLREFMLQLR